jgi:glyoxylase-like metal-dependent hydrolase (beta-lactamase superfamily II)
MRRIALAALLLAALTVRAQVEVAPNVLLIRGSFTPGTQPDGNSIVFLGPASLLVVDSGRHAEHTQKILDLAATLHLPVSHVVNTHWHLDHIGGNALLRKNYPDVQVYASGALHEALDGFLARYRAQLKDMIAKTADGAQKRAFETEVALIDAGAQLAPNHIIARPENLAFGGRSLELHLELFAVTAGDVWLFDKSAGIVIAGDLVTLPVPFLDTACPSRWNETLERLSKTDFDLLIPGHGAPLTHRQFDVYRGAFHSLLTCAAGPRDKGVCVDEWLAGTAAIAPAGDPGFTRSLVDYYVDVLRGDPARTASLCGPGA